MNSKEFIKNRLREIFDAVKSINIKYEYFEAEDTHIIEVTPISEFNDNSRYVELEKNLLFDFNDQFFPSTILFVSEDSMNKVNSPELTLLRKEYSIPTKILTNQINWSFTCQKEKISAGENNYALAA